MDRGKAESAGKVAALCERGPEDVRAIWRAAKYERKQSKSRAWERYIGCCERCCCWAGGKYTKIRTVILQILDAV